MSSRSWMSSATRCSSSPTARCSPRERWPRCGPVRKSSRLTLSADAVNGATPASGDVHGIELRTVDLTAGYNGSPVIHGISISVAPAEVVSIVGPNGSGKSTLLKSIVGVVETLSGQVRIGDSDVTGWRSEDIARIGVGYVPQVDDVFAPLTVRENLEMGGAIG